MNKKIFNTAFTMGATHVNRLYLQRIAFTMAEILLSLTIIGVVAAITLPSLTGNINEKAWKAQKKALYARMSQAIALMPCVNGYGIGETMTQTRSNAAKIFIQDGLRKVLKINNICNYNEMDKCGISSKYHAADGTKKDFPQNNSKLFNKLAASRSYNDTTVNISDSYNFTDKNMNAAAFETANGESIAVFYQPFCINSKETKNRHQYLFVAPYMCVNFIFDLNGKKGPNTAGKDIGSMTVFYPTNSQIVMPQVLPKDTTAMYYNGSSNDNFGVNAKILRQCTNADKSLRLPNKEELASMLINADFNAQERLAGNASRVYVASQAGSGLPWSVDGTEVAYTTLAYYYRVRCIER